MRFPKWLKISPMTFIWLIAAAMLFCVIVIPALFAAGVMWHIDTPWFFRMMDEARKNFNVFCNAGAIAAVAGIAAYLVNRNHDKIPDKMEGEQKDVTRNPVPTEQATDLRDGRKL